MEKEVEIGLYIYDKIVNMESPTKELKEIHTQNLVKCSAGDENAKRYIKALIRNFLTNTDIKNIDIVTDNIYADYWGLGPIEKYDTKEIDEIIVHGTKILVKKRGQIITVPECFNNEEETIAVIRRCLEFNKSQDLNSKYAIAEAKRKDGSRINAVISPVGKQPYLNIRKFTSFLPTTENMLKTKTLSTEEVEILSILVKGRANIIVIGEMESGKTTFINWLMQFFPKNLIIGIMETTQELYPDKLYPWMQLVQLEEQLPDYPMTELFKTMLRMSVDIMIVGECRGNEVNELIKSMSRGHSGSIGSAHSMDPSSVIDDFADMTIESGKNINLAALKYRIARTIDIVVKFRKLPTRGDGTRRKVCAGIYEIVTDDKDMRYEAVPIAEFETDEETPSDYGQHIVKNKISERLIKKLNEYGVKLSEIKKILGDNYV